MAYEIPVFVITVEAGSDLSSDQYKLVTLASDGQIDVTGNTSTNDALGILQNDPDAAGKAASVMVLGISRAIAGAAITVGQLVCPSAVTAGRLDPATSGERVVGRALESAAAGEYFPVLLNVRGIIA